MDAHPPSRFAFLRIAALVLVCAGCFAAPAIAQADDIIQLNGDGPVTLQGNYNFGLLYLDGVVRLAANTSITANDVFIGPDAALQTCWDIGTAGQNCTAGRSLSITASGGVAISPAIDLRGLIGTNRPGGSLAIRAARVSLGGGVETAGTAANSGSISIDSPGLVVTQTLHAPGNNVIVHGGAGVLIGGDAWSAGSDTATGADPNRLASGGVIELASSGGDVSVLGTVASWGHDVPGAGVVEGGNGGAVAISGGDVRVSGGIDSSAGRGVDLSAGQPGGIGIAARGGIVVSGPISAAGDTSTSGNVSPGANVTLTAAGAIATGSITTSGAGGPYGGAAGGAVTITGASVALGTIVADSGDATSDAIGGSGNPGGNVTIKATSNVTMGPISTHGGSGRTTGIGGPGGSVSVTGDRVTTGAIITLAENLGGTGGGVTLRSQSALLVGGAVDTAGAAGGNGQPGGGGGAISMLTGGPLTLGGRLRSEGGIGSNGGSVGAPGGYGAPIQLVVGSIASSAGVISGGGNGGNASVQGGLRGRGGNGGAVRVWSQLPSLILLQLVDSGGGTGDPNGADGPQVEESAPTNLALSKTRVLSWVTHSPDAEGYQVLVSLAGAPAKELLTTKAASVPLPKVAACVQADYSVVGYQNGIGWHTAPLGPISAVTAPSDTQACTDAPQVTLLSQKIKKKLKPLSKKKWKVPVRFLADGMGTAHVVLSRKKKILAFVDKPLAATRRNVSVTLTIPKKLRKSGKFTVTVTGSAPLGKARSKSTLTLEVKK